MKVIYGKKKNQTATFMYQNSSVQLTLATTKNSENLAKPTTDSNSLLLRTEIQPDHEVKAQGSSCHPVASTAARAKCLSR